MIDIQRQVWDMMKIVEEANTTITEMEGVILKASTHNQMINIRRFMKPSSKWHGKLGVPNPKIFSWWTGWLQRQRQQVCGWQYLRNPEAVQEWRTKEGIKQGRNSRRWRSNLN